MNSPIAPHGTLSRRKHHGCGCNACRSADHAYQARRHRLRGYGTWQPLTDVQPVRDHAAALVAAGYTIATIEAAAACTEGTLQRILYGPHKCVRTDVASRVLAVEADDMRASEHRSIDATGTRRRLQALAAIGWPLASVARTIGMHSRQMTPLTRTDHVTIGTARRIKAGYRRLVVLNPAEHGVPQNQVTTARRMAAARGWPGPLAWDDIDDPAEQPDLTGITTEHQHKKRYPAEVIEAEVRHLASCGEPTSVIAQRLGRSEKRIAEIVREAA